MILYISVASSLDNSLGLNKDIERGYSFIKPIILSLLKCLNNLLIISSGNSVIGSSFSLSISPFGNSVISPFFIAVSYILLATARDTFSGVIKYIERGYSFIKFNISSSLKCLKKGLLSSLGNISIVPFLAFTISYTFLATASDTFSGFNENILSG